MKAKPDSEVADELFAEFLDRYYQGQAGLDELCSEHPDHAGRFRALFEMLENVEEIETTRLPNAGPMTRETPAGLPGLEMVREIGRGGMGVVWEALDTGLGRRVAVKFLPEGRSVFAEARKRFEREVAAVGQLTHPNIVAVHRADLSGSRPYLVMEFVPGASLHALLHKTSSEKTGTRPKMATLHSTLRNEFKGNASDTSDGTTMTRSLGDGSFFEFVARIVAETAEALDYAHSRGITHRDVKPGNILIDLWGRVRLVDFGVSKIASEATMTATDAFAGTAAYAAPEQIAKSFGAIDGRTDVYSLGVVLFRMLTGKLPFEDSETRTLFHRILNEDAPKPRKLATDVPWELSVICNKALEKRQQDRYPTALGFAADLRAWLQKRPIVAKPPSTPRRMLRAIQRHPWASSLTLGVLLALLAIPVGSLLQQARNAGQLRSRAEVRLEEARSKLRLLEKKFQDTRDELTLRAGLRGKRHKGQTNADENRRYLEVFAKRYRSRDDITTATLEIHEDLEFCAAVLGPDLVTDTRLALWQAVHEFARATGERPLMRFAEKFLGVGQNQSDALIASNRSAVVFQVQPENTSVHLFRYLPEFQVRKDPVHPRLLPIPYDARTLEGVSLQAETWSFGETCEVVTAIADAPADSSAEPATLRRGDILLGTRADGSREVFREGALLALEIAQAHLAQVTRRKTQYPLFTSPQNLIRAGRTELPPGSYLALCRAAGHEDLRLPFVVDPPTLRQRGETNLHGELLKLGTTPPGFVHVPPGTFLAGGDRGRSNGSLPPGRRNLERFWIQREEVTFGEYLAALRWQEDREPGSTRDHLPHDDRGEFRTAFDIDPETYDIFPPGFANRPVCSIRFDDALFYCRILSAKAADQGSPWVYELPWQLSWEKAARGSDGRIFPWGGEEVDLVDGWNGDTFDWRLFLGVFSTDPPAWMALPTEQVLGDESPYGVLGLTGGVEEFAYLDPGKGAEATPARKGGGITLKDPLSYRLPRTVQGAATWIRSRGFGFRVVARRLGDPGQGIRQGTRKERP